jgi:transposase
MPQKKAGSGVWRVVTMPRPMGCCTPAWSRANGSTPWNERGLDGLGMKPGSGRKPRLTMAERSTVIALVGSPHPGRLVTYSAATLAPAGSEGGDVADWSLDALAAVAQAKGIQIGRSQVRRILRQEGLR